MSGGTDTASRQGTPCSFTLARRPITAPYAPVHRFLSSWNFTASACAARACAADDDPGRQQPLREVGGAVWRRARAERAWRTLVPLLTGPPQATIVLATDS